MRCLHESKCYEKNCFVTLTYDDEHLPANHSLTYVDFQLFMKRLRKYYSHRDDYNNLWRLPIRFFACGEYGDQTKRPHYHACLFGTDFADRVFDRRLASGSALHSSKILSSLWTHGFCSVGDVTFESAAYVARYIMKKRFGDVANEHSHYRFVDDYGEIHYREPEFARMSLKPGIGAPWYAKYSSEVYPRDEVIVRGKRLKPPKFYDTLLDSRDFDTYEFVLYARSKKALQLAEDATPARLKVRERVARAGLNVKRRTLE